jgi:transcriptional regulator with XRE-family HTH domain
MSILLANIFFISLDCQLNWRYNILRGDLMLNLKALRKALGLSQQAVANKIGVSRSAVAMWEINASEPDNGLLLRLSALLGVSVDELLGNDPPAPAGLSEKELSLLAAYQAKPEFQGAVDALLGLNDN